MFVSGASWGDTPPTEQLRTVPDAGDDPEMTTAATATGRFFATGHSQVVDEHDRILWQTLQGQTEGGKRFRPALLTRLYTALGGQDHQVAGAVGESIELLHTAFVIHDDVIDGDQVRRGRPNLGGTFDARARALGAATDRARHYGEAAGILAGDLALAGAVRTIALCGAPAHVVVRLLDLLEEVLHRSAAGELADVRVSMTADASLQETLDIAEWKTAAYSFELPLRAAAILADSSTEVCSALAAVGRCLGTAFQLLDDLDGVFGQQEQTGKDPLSDLREGKCTALVTFARATPEWEELARHVGDPSITSDNARRARELLAACGARRAVETLVHDLRETALAGAAMLPAEARATLRDMIESLVPDDRGQPVPVTADGATAPSLTSLQGAA
ncbi:polyprenyl synthetase family protein [Ornithinimicrobium ciconiae]|uniref:Polyprenyl synthetase family protein n=2 Tax=Ornithinimicrobium ciconiae TaxID=2594265 RepID=A0A516GEP3_9MICO|nr:polyprenyl synthetase family protein [Ornithinimicrobium ciconiae]